MESSYVDTKIWRCSSKITIGQFHMVKTKMGRFSSRHATWKTDMYLTPYGGMPCNHFFNKKVNFMMIGAECLTSSQLRILNVALTVVSTHMHSVAVIAKYSLGVKWFLQLCQSIDKFFLSTLCVGVNDTLSHYYAPVSIPR
ncbi:hypothetical protein CEXT_183521 [Caerostris extrusa]|uniref:Uncharacterized protein n=1 Tax=Caerostris extrusa TaxID=172846 RepID=A0AAV4MB91_CAEEX|nr:hypothetical protein CEXT_183521 [Caerostris extrusa]